MRLISYHYECKWLLFLYFLLQQYGVTFIFHITGKDTLYSESGQSCLPYALLTQFLLWPTAVGYGGWLPKTLLVHDVQLSD